MGKNIKILIVDDHKSAQLYIQNLIKSNKESIEATFDKTISIVGLISKGSEAIEAIENLKPNVVVLDLLMPDLHGLEIINEMASMENIKTKILIVSGEEYDEKINQLLKNNSHVRGFVNKSRLDNDLITAIFSVDLNNIFVSREPKQNYSINLLDVWKYAIAEKLISKWRYGNEVLKTPEQMIESLEVGEIKTDVKNNLMSESLEKSRKAIEEINKAYFEQEDVGFSSLSKAKEFISKWVNDNVFVSIDKSAKVSRIDKICLFKERIDLDWHQASPAQLSKYLEILSENLETILKSHESQRNFRLEKSIKVEQAFDCLKSKLESEQSLESRKKLWKSGMNALVVLNEELLIAHICSAEIFVLQGLISSVENYYDRAAQTDRLLFETQKKLNKLLEPVLERIDVKNELECFTEKKLIEWGASPSVSSSLLLDQLLSSINFLNISQELDNSHKPKQMFPFTRDLDLPEG